MSEEKYKKIIEYLETGIDTIRKSGLKVLECREKFIKLSLPLSGNTNHIGIMYGGSLLILAEMSGGAIFAVTFNHERYIPLIKNINMKFRKPAFSDVSLEVSLDNDTVDRIREELHENGKSDFVLNMEIKDISGEVVSIVEGIYQIRNMPAGMKSPIL